MDEEKGCCGFQLGSWGAWSGSSACCRNRAGKQALCRLDLGHNAAERGSISVVYLKLAATFKVAGLLKSSHWVIARGGNITPSSCLLLY